MLFSCALFIPIGFYFFLQTARHAFKRLVFLFGQTVFGVLFFIAPSASLPVRFLRFFCWFWLTQLLRESRYEAFLLPVKPRSELMLLVLLLQAPAAARASAPCIPQQERQVVLHCGASPFVCWLLFLCYWCLFFLIFFHFSSVIFLLRL